ncbi:MAG: hypothetical protein WCO31_00665, partial [Actinomycetes bacterium]
MADADEVKGQGEKIVALKQLEESLRPSRPQPLWLGMLLVAIVWLLGRIVIAIHFPAARNPFSLDTGRFMGLDSFNYVKLASHAPSFGRCGYPPFEINVLMQHQQWWCGTAVWLPGYPMLIRVVHVLGISLKTSGLLIAWISILASLLLVWFAWLRDLDLPRTFLILILAANTAYADFPRLASIIARDGFLPRQFFNRGARLVFSNGVLFLA